MMIALIAKGINLFAFALQRVLLLASFIGRVIVAALAGITNAVYSAFENLIKFFQIVYEDNIRIFSEEIPNFVTNIIDTCSNQIDCIHNVFSSVYSDFTSKVYAVVGIFKYIIISFLTLLCEVLYLLKEAFIFIGNTVWFIITFLPIHLPELVQVVFKYIKNVVVGIVVDAYLALLKFTNFMTDVPLESFIGITSAVILFRLLIHFRFQILSQAIEIYWLFVRKMLFLYHSLYNYITDSEVRVITHMSSNQDVLAIEVNPDTSQVDDVSGSDALCIICQERQKCVLTLPCRHVCLCTECCRRLYGYQRTCPICRTFIYHSVTVYL